MTPRCPLCAAPLHARYPHRCAPMRSRLAAFGLRLLRRRVIEKMAKERG